MAAALLWSATAIAGQVVVTTKAADEFVKALNGDKLQSGDSYLLTTSAVADEALVKKLRRASAQKALDALTRYADKTTRSTMAMVLAIQKRREDYEPIRKAFALGDIEDQAYIFATKSIFGEEGAAEAIEDFVLKEDATCDAKIKAVRGLQWGHVSKGSAALARLHGVWKEIRCDPSKRAFDPGQILGALATAADDTALDYLHGCVSDLKLPDQPTCSYLLGEIGSPKSFAVLLALERNPLSSLDVVEGATKAVVKLKALTVEQLADFVLADLARKRGAPMSTQNLHRALARVATESIPAIEEAFLAGPLCKEFDALLDIATSSAIEDFDLRMRYLSSPGFIDALKAVTVTRNDNGPGRSPPPTFAKSGCSVANPAKVAYLIGRTGAPEGLDALRALATDTRSKNAAIRAARGIWTPETVQFLREVIADTAASQGDRDAARGSLETISRHIKK